MRATVANLGVEFLHWTAQALYLFAPLFVALMLSAVVQRFDLARWLRVPIDAHMKLRGQPLFGDSKTWRGVVVAIAGCIFGAAVQKNLLADQVGSISLIDYRSLNVWLFGLAMGAGAMLGELPNSFVKRRLRIAPGGTASGSIRALFYVWDQVDVLTAAWLVLRLWLIPSAGLVFTSFVLALVLHPAISLVGYALGRTQDDPLIRSSSVTSDNRTVT